jgi:hypothetical protein
VRGGTGDGVGEVGGTAHKVVLPQRKLR